MTGCSRVGYRNMNMNTHIPYTGGCSRVGYRNMSMNNLAHRSARGLRKEGVGLERHSRP